MAITTKTPSSLKVNTFDHEVVEQNEGQLNILDFKKQSKTPKAALNSVNVERNLRLPDEYPTF